MGYSFGGPIVTDGLHFYVDGADNNSYPDSGTTWFDLVGNQNLEQNDSQASISNESSDGQE